MKRLGDKYNGGNNLQYVLPGRNFTLYHKFSKIQE